MRRKILPLLVLGFAWLPVSCADNDELPPPEMTEYWEPVPEVVSAPPDAPPSDAIVLFDGSNLDAWKPAVEGAELWRIEDGALVVTPAEEGSNIVSRQSFGDVQLHLEFRSPAVIEGEGQGRGNSGIFFMGLYEIQVLDSYENPTYVNGQLGSIYKQHPPLVNPARPPGEWQTYDVVFIAPRFSAGGSLESPARMTAFLNGVLVQHDAVLTGPTVWRGEPKYSPHEAKLPLVLQDHQDHVGYRNIWIRELNLP